MTAWATSICVAEPVEAALQHSMQHSMQHAVDALVTKLRLKLAGRPRPHLAAARINAAAVARAVARLDHALERFTHVRIDEEMQQQRRRAFLGLLLGDELVELRTADRARLCRCSPDTALRDIDALVALSILDKGSACGRSTRYRLVRR